MDKLRIGILCPSEIAIRRFLPALRKLPQFEYAGVAVARASEWFGGGLDDGAIKAKVAKAERFRAALGGEIFEGYETLLERDDIDCVYIPLPPGLHYEWAENALRRGKHVLLEKPFTDSLAKTAALIELARERNLAIHENYMFQYHSQIEYIINKIKSGAIGEVRLYRLDFGFPLKGAGDFRYKKALGGGALLDCGGYPLRLASLLLGDTARVAHALLSGKEGFEVDMYGHATLVNDDGTAAQISFGLDNAYRCSLEVWGSRGTLFTNRIFTAPDGFAPIVTIRAGDGAAVDETLPPDDSFQKSLERFDACVRYPVSRVGNCESILRQARLVERMVEITREGNNASHGA
jgi:predicted dehydrogenase